MAEARDTVYQEDPMLRGDHPLCLLDQSVVLYLEAAFRTSSGPAMTTSSIPQRPAGTGSSREEDTGKKRVGSMIWYSPGLASLEGDKQGFPSSFVTFCTPVSLSSTFCSLVLPQHTVLP